MCQTLHNINTQKPLKRIKLAVQVPTPFLLNQPIRNPHSYGLIRVFHSKRTNHEPPFILPMYPANHQASGMFTLVSSLLTSVIHSLTIYIWSIAIGFMGELIIIGISRFHYGDPQITASWLILNWKGWILEVMHFCLLS